MFRWKNTLSVRGPLITVISLILVIGFLTTNIISYQISKQSLRTALIDNELPLTSNNIYSEIQRDLLQPIFVASLMATDTFVKAWIEGGENNLHEITNYLDQIRLKYNLFTSFLISESTRNYYHFSDLTQVVSEDDPNDAWYFHARALKEPYEINVDFNAAQNNTLTIFINHQIHNKAGKLLGVTGVGLAFDTVATVIDRYAEQFGRNVYFIDDSGTILGRSDGASISEDNIHSARGISQIAEGVLASDRGFFEFERDDETLLLTSRRIPELGWWVVVEQNEGQALSAIRQGLITNSLIGIGVIAITILIVIYTVNLFYARLEVMSTTDELTGVASRQVFDLNLQQAMKRRLRDGAPVSIIMMDIDRFKVINDTHGHLNGDLALQETARIMQSIMRVSDTLCRWGGDEFIVIAQNCNIHDATIIAEKSRDAIEKITLMTLPGKLQISVSAGVTEVKDSDSMDDAIARADAALYHAKEDGRNRVHAIV